MTDTRPADGTPFGEFSRYLLVRHVSHRGERFNCWMVLDAECPDPITNTPGIIRQAATPEAACKGLQGVSYV